MIFSDGTHKVSYYFVLRARALPDLFIAAIVSLNSLKVSAVAGVWPPIGRQGVGGGFSWATVNCIVTHLSGFMETWFSVVHCRREFK